MSDMPILIYAQTDKENNILPVVGELVTKAQELSKKANNAPVYALLIGNTDNYEKAIEQLKSFGVDKIFLTKDIRLAQYNTNYYKKVFVDFIKQFQPQILLIGATIQGRDLAPAISATLSTGLTADCTGLDITTDGKLAATRPTFGGNLMATILCKTLPQMATVRPDVFLAKYCETQKDTIVEEFCVNLDGLKRNIQLLELIENNVNADNSLKDAKIIVAGGKGMKTKEGFALLERLAQKLNASLAASRGAVELGLASPSIQIGQTGKTVSPKIYIACGISGAIQHVVGINSAKTIIAINSDENAPIFKVADYKIVANASDVINEWLKI